MVKCTIPWTDPKCACYYFDFIILCIRFWPLGLDSTFSPSLTICVFSLQILQTCKTKDNTLYCIFANYMTKAIVYWVFIYKIWLYYSFSIFQKQFWESSLWGNQIHSCIWYSNFIKRLLSSVMYLSETLCPGALWTRCFMWHHTELGNSLNGGGPVTHCPSSLWY